MYPILNMSIFEVLVLGRFLHWFLFTFVLVLSSCLAAFCLTDLATLLPGESHTSVTLSCVVRYVPGGVRSPEDTNCGKAEPVSPSD